MQGLHAPAIIRRLFQQPVACVANLLGIAVHRMLLHVDDLAIRELMIERDIGDRAARDRVDNRKAPDRFFARSSMRLQPFDNRTDRLNIGIFDLQIGEVGEVITLVLIRACLDRNNGAIAIAQRIHSRRPNAAGR